MRWQLGVGGVLLGAVAGLGADPAGDALDSFPPSPPRSARLLAPQLLDAQAKPAFYKSEVIRAQGEPLPPLGMTPVRRSPMASPPARPVQSPPPAWLRGVAEAESVLPTAASVPSVSPDPHTTSEAQSGWTNRSNPQPPAVRLFSKPAFLATGTTNAAATPPPSAQTPFRGTNTQGATIYAGPPAYRWYGYGAATPPAFLVQSHGQYPRASADWYHITGATAGAFPMPVLAAPSLTDSLPAASGNSRSQPLPTLSVSQQGTQPVPPAGTLPPPVQPTPPIFQPSRSIPSVHHSIQGWPASAVLPAMSSHDSSPSAPVAPLPLATSAAVPAIVQTPALPEASHLPLAMEGVATPSHLPFSPPVQESPPTSLPEHSPWKPAAVRRSVRGVGLYPLP